MVHIILYHGTLDTYANDILKNGISLKKSKPFLDFGPGFYTTPNIDFARNTAKFRAKRYNLFNRNHKMGWKIVEIVCDDDEFYKINLKYFNSPNMEWGMFVLANRCENEEVHNAYDNNIMRTYDIVSGPTADGTGTLAPMIAGVSDGTILLENIDYTQIAPSTNKVWGSQISFHTLKSLSCITEISML